MEFFNEEDFKFLNQYAGLRKNESEEHQTAYEALKKTYNKVSYWADSVVEIIFNHIQGYADILKKPTNQANIFEKYQWAKIYPAQNSSKELAFTISINNENNFSIKIDTVGLKDNDQRRKEYLKYRGDYNNSKIVYNIPKENILSKDWGYLINLTSEYISSLINHFYELEELLGLQHYIENKVYQIVSKPVNMSLNKIFYGPPGTGKTYNCIDSAVEIAAPDGYSAGEHLENKSIFDALRQSGQIEFVTFHQNYSYEDFIVGIRPDAEFEQLRFKPYKGIFYQLAKRARDNYIAAKDQTALSKTFEEAFNEVMRPLIEENTPVKIEMISGVYYTITDVNDSSIFFEKPKGDSKHSLSIQTLKEAVEGVRTITSGLLSYYSPLVDIIRKLMKPATGIKSESLKNFVIIIDEINRANISRVFGELITLLEDDKRIGKENELKITLPNGEKDFGVPPNLYIIGTMNTADKSIALVDIALRRRFEFIGFYPDYELPELNSSDALLLKQINKNIYTKKKSADYLIGHAYFLNNNQTEFILRNKVIPLLIEYFAGKTEIVTDIFAGTGWEVKYNEETYSWNINPPAN